MELWVSSLAAIILACVAVYLAAANRQKITKEGNMVEADGTSKIVAAATQLVERVEASTSFTLATYEERLTRAESELIAALKDRAQTHERLAIVEAHTEECERDRTRLLAEVADLQRAIVGGRRHDDSIREESNDRS